MMEECIVDFNIATWSNLEKQNKFLPNHSPNSGCISIIEQRMLHKLQPLFELNGPISIPIA